MNAIKKSHPHKASRQKELTPDEVKHVAHLARLILTPAEIKKYSQQLTKIFDYISMIGQLPTKRVTETNQTTGRVNVFREDEVDVTKILTQEEAIGNAPASHHGYFKVKAIFD